MEKLHASFKDITKYLIELFYRTNKKYSCSSRKLGMLLSILAFSYAREGKKLFEEKIYIIHTNGTTIDSLTSFIDTHVYYILKDVDDKQPINYIPIYTYCYIPQKYKCCDYPSKEICLRIQEIFQKFGSYSMCDLITLTKIMEIDNLIENDTSINLEKISKLHLSDFEKANELVEYLFSKRGE
ncbi:MAG: hypothetical protein E7311_00120 [Clostridiales bacterium]|nr:hypothetical protein [Clostridiales bacterium]